jgi:DNA-binding MarR family transcriptional regulator
MSVSSPSISSMIDGLVERSLVMRLPNAVNRRQIRLAMTDPGRELLRRYDGLVAEHLDRLLAPMTLRARRRLFQAVTDLHTLLDTLETAEELATED